MLKLFPAIVFTPMKYYRRHSKTAVIVRFPAGGDILYLVKVFRKKKMEAGQKIRRCKSVQAVLQNHSCWVYHVKTFLT